MRRRLLEKQTMETKSSRNETESRHRLSFLSISSSPGIKAQSFDVEIQKTPRDMSVAWLHRVDKRPGGVVCKCCRFCSPPWWQGEPCEWIALLAYFSNQKLFRSSKPQARLLSETQIHPEPASAWALLQSKHPDGTLAMSLFWRWTWAEARVTRAIGSGTINTVQFAWVMAAGINALLKYFSSTLEIKFLQEFGAGVHEEYMNMESNQIPNNLEFPPGSSSNTAPIPTSEAWVYRTKGFEKLG